MLGWVNLSIAESISNYIVDITIEQSGELAVTESITYDFGTASRHGIFRDIPFMIRYNDAKRDIGIDKPSISMDHKAVNWRSSVHHSQHAGDVIRFRIGSANKLITGKHLYTISYRVHLGVLPSSDATKDAVRWNAIGTGWKVDIDKAEVNFHLPASMDKNSVNVSSYTGAYGSRRTKAYNKWITPEHLRVSAEYFMPHEGLTAEVAFEQNTLSQSGVANLKATKKEKFLANWYWGALVGVLLFFYARLKEQTGYVDRRYISPRYTAPDGLSLLQSGLILDKQADIKDFAPAVLELAQLGYVEIDGSGKGKSTTLKITSKKNLQAFIGSNISTQQCIV